jgi:hypothetical protein
MKVLKSETELQALSKSQELVIDPESTDGRRLVCVRGEAQTKVVSSKKF